MVCLKFVNRFDENFKARPQENRPQLIKKSTWLLHLNGGKAPPTARDRNVVVRILRYPHTGYGGLSWCLSSSVSCPVGFSIQEKAMGIDRWSLPRGFNALAP